MKIIWKGETLDVPEEYGKRLVGQGAEIVTSSVTADAVPPSPEGKAETEGATSSGAGAPPSALHGNNQPEQSSGVVPHPKGKAKKESA